MIRLALPLCLLFAALPLTVHAQDLNPISNIDFVRDLYIRVNNTPPSNISKKEHEAIIHRRLDCYEKTFEFTERIEKCNQQYNNDIVKQARKAVSSNPELGRFVRNLILCPIMYNICSGKTDNNVERCIRFERQCIDYMLDLYWRDKPKLIILKKEQGK